MKLSILFVLVLFGCGPTPTPANLLPALRDSKYQSRPLGIGVVIPDLMQNFVQMSYHTTDEQATRVQLAQKAIRDAHNQGAGHITILAPGFFPQSPEDVARGYNDLALWQINPNEYWYRIDTMMYAISQQDLPIVVHGWEDLRIFATLAGETTRDLITNPNSKSYSLYVQYWTTWMARYGDFPNIEIYSAPNEMNLIADLNMVARCTSECGSIGNFTTDEMIVFSSRIVSLMHGLTSKPILSSMGLQRPNANHLRLQPEWSQNGPDWTQDSENIWMGNLMDISAPFDIVDSHAYNGTDGKVMEVFGYSNAELINAIANVAKNNGKLYFISEFGDQFDPLVPDRTITKQIMQTLIDNNTLGGSVWGYEYYQTDTYGFQQDGNTTVYDLIPGNYASMFNLMKTLNLSLHILNF